MKKKFFSTIFALFNHDDKLYLTDSNKKTHLFDLNEGKYLGFKSFDQMYPELKKLARTNKVESKMYEAPYLYKFPNLQNGKDVNESLAKHLGMKVADSSSKKDEQYKIYTFNLAGTVFRNGDVKVENIESHDEIPKEKIIEFFDSNKFETKRIPEIIEQWFIESTYFHFRNSDDKIARQEKKEEIIERRKALEKHKTAEKINDIYIPRDLGEAFVELDKLLKDVDKAEMKALPKRDSMINYHMGLGMWMRNNWGLWSSSRLQTYFLLRGVTHPDDMSGVILDYYYDWLNGNQESWKAWDKNSLSKAQKKIV